MRTRPLAALEVIVVALPAWLAAGAAALQSSPDAVATRGVTVQPTGPRGGDAGARFVNAEGKGNGKYASFALLTFAPPEAAAKAARVEGLTLSLVQSVARFSKDGKVKFFLVADPPADDALKFEEDRPGGLGAKFEGRVAVGSGSFTKAETGHADVFPLALDGPARALVEARVAAKKDLTVLIAPDDDAVAATYFGAGAEDAARRPRLAFKPAAP